MKSTILVTGATGHVGGEVAKQLVEAGHTVRGLVKSDDRATALPAGVQAVVGDLNEPPSMAGALHDVTGLFLLPGYKNMPELLALAHRSGVKHVVQLSGRSASSGDMSNAITKFMTDSENAVRASELFWTIVRPSAFMTKSLEWAEQIKTGDTVRAAFPNVLIAVIDPYDIGAVAAHILAQPTGHEGQVYLLSGPKALSNGDQVAILGNVLGRKLSYVPLSNEEARTEMSKTTPAEYVDAFFDFYVAGTLDESPVLPTVEMLTGKAPRTFEQWTSQHIAAFQGK